MNNEHTMICIVDNHHGIYIPQIFAEIIRSQEQTTGAKHGGWKNITDEQLSILLAGPDHEEYWDAWDEVTTNAQKETDGRNWQLLQDCDLFMVPPSQTN